MIGQVAHLAKLHSNGLSTDRLFRRNGKKALRGLPHGPVNLEHKEAGAEAVRRFQEALPLLQPLAALHTLISGRLRPLVAQGGQSGKHAADRLARLVAADQCLKALPTHRPRPHLALPVEEQNNFVTFLRSIGAAPTRICATPRPSPYVRGALAKDAPGEPANAAASCRPRPAVPTSPGAHVLAPGLSPYTELIFSGIPGAYYISAMSEAAVVRDAHGAAFFDDRGVFISARLPASERLCPAVLHELLRICAELVALRPHCPRGGSHAGMCKKFVATGHKCGQDERVSMPHWLEAASENEQMRYLNAMAKLGAWYTKHVYPRVAKYFAGVLDATEDFFIKAKLTLWSTAATGATLGVSLWNRAHTDDDLGLTVLVAQGKPTAGGEFAHPAHGLAHQVEEGDVLIVNPLLTHGTAEFDYAEGDELREMVAFFLKTSVVTGLATGQAYAIHKNIATKPPGKAARRGGRGHASAAKKQKGALGGPSADGADGSGSEGMDSEHD